LHRMNVKDEEVKTEASDELTVHCWALLVYPMSQEIKTKSSGLHKLKHPMNRRCSKMVHLMVTKMLTVRLWCRTL
jgi:hypothetical protein